MNTFVRTGLAVISLAVLLSVVAGDAAAQTMNRRSGAMPGAADDSFRPFTQSVSNPRVGFDGETFLWSASGDTGASAPIRRRSPAASQPVSVARLLHAPSAKAERLFVKAMSEEDLAESIELLRKAIEVHPDYIEALNNLAVRLSRMEQYEEAVGHFQRLLELDPNDAKAWANLGIALDAMGDPQAAETAAKRGLDAAPRDPLASYLLGALLLRGESDLARAATLLGTAASEFPDAGLLQVEALLAAGETGRAREAVRRLAVAARAHSERR